MTAGRSSTLPATAAAGPRKSSPGSTWTEEETLHLIEAYEERWYSLKRGQLKAQQWEEVAAEVAVRCALPSPSKNGTQCRHKIEKLRKRYRSERLRSVRSSWPFFDRMDRMESVPASISTVRPTSPSSSDGDDNSVEPHGSNTRSINGILREAAPWEDARVSRNPGQLKRRAEEGNGDEEENKRDNDEEEEAAGEDGGGGDGAKGEGIAEMAAELRRFGKGYVRMERKRMEIVKEMEREWMEMEAKKMEMIMEAQRCLLETIAGVFSKKAKNSEEDM
ncbi:hypothetical protein KSP39_PZI003038 [Platanthera zijinensis]|uniref:Myb-like domain-containing protein n=1 Tax=Platanthera zijinensis TaxID=2320716 RepID=A0AAP0BVC8_9ASPA